MKKLYFLLICFCIYNHVIAQNIKTAKDSTVLIDCAKMPMNQAQYNLSFTARHLDLNYESKSDDDSNDPIENLISKIEENPKDYKVARKIVDYYRKQSNQEKFMQYYEPFYNNVYEDYQNNPNDFETVELFCILLQETQNIDGMFSVWDKFITDNPKEIKALTTYANQLAVKGEISKAKLHIQQAYEIDNQFNEVYIAAMMCEFVSTIVGLTKALNSGLDEAAQNKLINDIKIDDSFFKQAIKSKAPPAAQMALDATNLMLVYYRSLMSIADLSLGDDIITLKANASDDKLLKDIEKRALAQIKKKYKNLYFAHKVLCSIGFLRGDQAKAISYWKAAGSYLENDGEILRLLSFGYLLKKDFKNAILFSEKILDSNYEDAATLGRLYTLNKEFDKAFDLFSEISAINPNDERAFCAKIAVLIQDKKFDQAAEFITRENISEDIANNIDLVHLNYYIAVATLISGDKNDAFKRLKAIHAESEYKKDAEKLLQHFFEQVND